MVMGGVSFWSDEDVPKLKKKKVLKLDSGNDGTILNFLKTSELYILKR